MNVCNATPILHALFRMAFCGREIGGQPFARLVAPADPRRPVPASTGASADRAGGYLVVPLDGRRILGLQSLRRRRRGWVKMRLWREGRGEGERERTIR